MEMISHVKTIFITENTEITEIIVCDSLRSFFDWRFSVAGLGAGPGSFQSPLTKGHACARGSGLHPRPAWNCGTPARGYKPLLPFHGVSPTLERPWAQDQLTLTVRRDWGYGNGSQIQGHFSMEAVGPENLTAVVFKIDEAIVAEVTRPPFKVQFVTDDYPPGWHNLIAVGKTSDARTLTSAPRRFEFVAGAEAWAGAQRIIVSVLGAVMVVMAIVLTLQFVATRTGSKKRLPLGAPRKYGIAGGTICPKCQRPFALHWWSFNAGFRKFDRCEHCGQWSLVRRMSHDQLTRAEAAEARLARAETPAPELNAEEKLRRQLDESRFDNGR